MMKKYEITTLPRYSETPEAIFDERETGKSHLPFSIELALCKSIESGDEETLLQIINNTLSSEIVMGNLSNNSVSQTRFWAVTVIATAVHYAILGGMDETDAYNFSDRCIHDIEVVDSLDNCIDYLSKNALALAKMVAASHKDYSLSPRMKKAVHYIHLHLHDRISANDLASVTGLSASYLSRAFKHETGLSLHDFIIKEKLKEAQRLLSEGMTCKEASYILGFCNQSHFTQCYKNEFGHTPGSIV